jgi:hypothetical protein
MAIFHSYVNVYQRVTSFLLLTDMMRNPAEVFPALGFATLQKDL